ncbi:MAG: hypothetical protein HQL06_11545 [Nitrospirae bacterium]|nr:hypothetical protein [Nitrospirota bacterium]
MMIKKTALVCVFILIITGLTGCDYKKLKKENETLKKENEALQKEKQILETDFNAIRENISNAKKEIETTKIERDDLKVSLKECDGAKNKAETARSEAEADKKRIEVDKDRVERECSEKITIQKCKSICKNVTDKVKTTDNLSNAEISQFMDDWIVHETDNSLSDSIVNLYADNVDYCELGSVSREVIKNHKNGYFKHWPIRQYTIRQNETTITSGDKPSEKTVKVTYDSVIKKNNTDKEGEIKVIRLFKLIKQDGKILIIKEKDITR